MGSAASDNIIPGCAGEFITETGMGRYGCAVLRPPADSKGLALVADITAGTVCMRID